MIDNGLRFPTLNHARACPRCHRVTGTAYEISQVRVMARVGDVSMCAECGLIEIYDLRDGRMCLREATQHEIERMAPDVRAQIVALQRQIMELRRLPR